MNKAQPNNKKNKTKMNKLWQAIFKRYEKHDNTLIKSQ